MSVPTQRQIIAAEANASTHLARFGAIANSDSPIHIVSISQSVSIGFHSRAFNRLYFI